ncbi:hypothetical protein, partial [Helicobacter felis]|uniref:hypothetical protein n=1 Tax=Helicobacter felis TaxID=214 RepID=UPI001F090DBB
KSRSRQRRIFYQTLCVKKSGAWEGLGDSMADYGGKNDSLVLSFSLDFKWRMKRQPLEIAYLCTRSF